MELECRPKSQPGMNRHKRPDFFIVGAPKCGTTAMVEYLSAVNEMLISNCSMLGTASLAWASHRFGIFTRRKPPLKSKHLIPVHA